VSCVILHHLSVTSRGERVDRDREIAFGLLASIPTLTLTRHTSIANTAIMDNVDDEFPLPSEDSLPSTYASTPVPLSTSAADDGIDDNTPFIGITSPLSYPDEDFTINDDDTTITDGNDDTVDDGLDDIEVLAAKACALASVPVPDYTEAFARQDRHGKNRKKNKEKYTTQRYLDKVTRRAAKDKDPNSVVLANKTSNILSEFQDYITEIDNESQLSSGKELLDYDSYSGEVMTGSSYGGSIDEEGGAVDGLVAREWHYDGYVNKQNESLTKNRNLYNGGDDYGDDDDRNIESFHSSYKEKRYTLPLLHSKYVKTGVTGVIVLGILLGTTIALFSGEGTDNAHEDPIVRDKDLQQQSLQKDGNHAEDTGQDEILAEADLELYVKVFEEFEPMLHDREDGWEGQTYEDAIQYCSSTEGYEICSYAAICPLGPDHEPVGGYKDNLSDGGSSLWVPISNGPNAWIGVSTDNSCVSYEEKLSRAPEWGITGEHNVDITQTILCCKRSVSGTGEVAFRYEDIAEKHRPNWYDRSEGWVGRTYNEAVAFCLNRAQVLCPYEAYCPMADLDSPLGGVIEDEPNGSWVATSDVPNSWISVGPEDTCKPYDAVNGEVPEWGITGIANEEVTRHVMCCKSLEDDDDVGALGSQEDGDEPNN